MSNEYLLYVCILYNTVYILCTCFQDNSVRIRIHYLIWIMFIHGKIETNSKIDIVCAGDRLNICFMDGGKVLFSSPNEFRGVGIVDSGDTNARGALFQRRLCFMICIFFQKPVQGPFCATFEFGLKGLIGPFHAHAQLGQNL